VAASKHLRMMFLRESNGFEGKPRHRILAHECHWPRASSVSPLLVSVRVGFVEPFGNLLEAFERGRFQTPWNVVSKGGQWFPSQKQSSPRRVSLALACECQGGLC
jgi:hypothetical protein